MATMLSNHNTYKLSAKANSRFASSRLPDSLLSLGRIELSQAKLLMIRSKMTG